VKSTALLLHQDLSLHVGERELPDPRVGEVIVRVEWAGICGSDLHVLSTGDWVASWPATLGHEVVGVVEECPGDELAIGTRVVVDSRVPCGACEGCGDGPNRCERLAWVGEAHPGGFQSALLMAVDRVVECPPGLEAPIAVLAEPLAVAMHAVRRVTTEPRHVRILGYGPIGALVHLEVTRRWPRASVSVVEPSLPRRQLARAFGAAVEGDEPYLVAPAQLVVDAAGYATSLLDAVSNCANGATVLVVALGHDPVQFVPAGLAERELTILGSNGFSDELADAVAVLCANPDRYRPVVTEAVLLEDVPERLRQLAKSPSAGKILVRP